MAVYRCSTGTENGNVLKPTSGVVAAGAFSGLASAGDATIEVNVGYENERGRGVAKQAASEVVREFDFDALTMRVRRNAIEGLENNPNGRYVEENGTMEALAQLLPWGQDRVDSEVAHTNGETGAGADIAILDTGIDSAHPDLTANVGEGTAFVSCSTKGSCRYDAKPAENTCYTFWDDDNDYGSHCAGIADAVDNGKGVVGASTEATLHAVKVLDKCGSGSFSDIAAGVEYVANQGWDVASTSLGGASNSSTLKDACQYAHDNGVFLVAAAGNAGPCTDCVGYPAAYSTVVAVSSTNESDGLSSFSSTGPEVEIAAPGPSVNSTVPGGYAEFSGRSMACPHVDGAAGQLMADGLTNTETRNKRNSTAEDVGLGSNESGDGLLDVAAALGYDSSNN
jgi:subtilisin